MQKWAGSVAWTIIPARGIFSRTNAENGVFVFYESFAFEKKIHQNEKGSGTLVTRVQITAGPPLQNYKASTP